ncbi:hypothetical protein [Methylobacterium sp. JK268]
MSISLWSIMTVMRQFLVTWSAHKPARSPMLPLMRLPARQGGQLILCLHGVQEEEDFADLVDDRGRQAGRIVLLDQSPQAFVFDVPNSHPAAEYGS